MLVFNNYKIIKKKVKYFVKNVFYKKLLIVKKFMINIKENVKDFGILIENIIVKNNI